jgi:hypothetical protein
MSFDVVQKKSYSSPAKTLGQFTSQALETLGGKPSGRSNPTKGMFEVNFNKKVKNNALPNRIDLQIKIVPDADGGCNVMAKAFPVDPMGNKLTFGVQGNAAEVVMTTFIDELEKNINA